MFRRIGGLAASLFAMVVLTASAEAEEAKVETMSVAALDAHYASCTDEFDGYMQSIRACVGKVFNEQDAYLNQLWASLKGKLEARDEKPEVFATLLDEQRKWLSFRDESCRFYYEMEGTIWRTSATDCRFNIVQGRLKALERFNEDLTPL